MFSMQKIKNTWIGACTGVINGVKCILNLLWLYKLCDMREKFPYGGFASEDDHQTSMPID